MTIEHRETFPACPGCQQPLECVHYNPRFLLNRDQWNATKAGDYVCRQCPSNGRGKSGYAYYWAHEVMQAGTP